MVEIIKKNIERHTKIIIDTNGTNYIQIMDIPFDVVILKVVISIGNKFFHFTPQNFTCEIKDKKYLYEIPLPLEVKYITDNIKIGPSKVRVNLITI